jgi:hypothetical protein
MQVVQSPPLEFVMLRNVRPAGPVIGKFSGADIVSEIRDEFGRTYVYAGVALRKWNGRFDTACLAVGEFILEPGLVYRIATLPMPYTKKLGTWLFKR